MRRPETQTWCAYDVVLARPIRVHLLSTDQSNDRLLAAARRAAIANDYRVLRVLDAVLSAEDADESWIGPYIVCEYAEGLRLQDLLAPGP